MYATEHVSIHPFFCGPQLTISKPYWLLLKYMQNWISFLTHVAAAILVQAIILVQPFIL